MLEGAFENPATASQSLHFMSQALLQEPFSKIPDLTPAQLKVIPDLEPGSLVLGVNGFLESVGVHLGKQFSDGDQKIIVDPRGEAKTGWSNCTACR